MINNIVAFLILLVCVVLGAISSVYLSLHSMDAVSPAINEVKRSPQSFSAIGLAVLSDFFLNLFLALPILVLSLPIGGIIGLFVGYYLQHRFLESFI